MTPYYIAITVLMITVGLFLSKYELKYKRNKRWATLKKRPRKRRNK